MSEPQERKVARGPRAKVGMTKNEGTILKNKVRDLKEQVADLKAHLSNVHNGMSEVQFVDALVLQMAAGGGKGLPKEYQGTAWLAQALDLRQKMFEVVRERQKATV